MFGTVTITRFPKILLIVSGHNLHRNYFAPFRKAVDVKRKQWE